MPRELDALYGELRTAVEASTRLRVDKLVLDAQAHTLRDFHAKHKSYQCLVINSHVQMFDIVEHFGHIVMFEGSSSSSCFSQNQMMLEKLNCLRSRCAQADIGFSEFDTYSLRPMLRRGHDQDEEHDEREESIARCLNEKQLIVSSRVATNMRLVDLLETRAGFELFERNYDAIAHQFDIDSNTLGQVEILLDESSGLLLVDVLELRRMDRDALSALRTRVKYLRMCLVSLHILIAPLSDDNDNDNDSDNDDDSEVDLASMCALTNDWRYEELRLMCLDLTTRDTFRLKLVVLMRQRSVQACVERLHASALSQRRSLFQFAFGPLSPEPSSDEIVLLSLACLNSFSAQQLLAEHTFVELLAMSAPEFSATFAMLHKKVRNAFVDAFFMPLHSGSETAS